MTTFEERQRFDQWWLWLIIGTALVTFWSVSGVFSDKPSSTFTSSILILAFIPLVLFFYFARLVTVIDESAIRVSFWPFAKKVFKWEDIETVEVVNYGFVGGWGVRLGTKYGTVYNASGKMGLAIVLKNGNKFCVGTRKPDELAAIIDSKMTPSVD